MIKRYLFFIIVLSLLASPLFAGGQKPAGKTGAAEKASILVWWTVRKPIMELTKERLKDFEAAHPNISVELVGMPGDALQQKLIGATQAGIGPDVVYIDEDLIRVMYNTGVLKPVPDEVYTEGDLLKMFGPKAKMSKIDGKYYGFPNGDMASVLFYNIDILKDSGMDPANIPATWAEFIPLAQKMTDLSKDIQGLPIRTREVSMWLAITHQNGGFMFRNGKEAMCAEKPGVDAAQFILDIYDKYKISSRTSLNSNEAFGQGKAPFLYNWTWYIGSLETGYPDTNFGTRLLPTPTGKPPHGTYGPSYGIFVSYTDEKNKDAAWEFWKFAISPEFQLGWSMLRGLVPSRLEAQKSEIFGKQPYKALAEAVKLNVSTSFFTDTVGSIRGTMIEKIMEGAPIKETLAAAQKELNDYLKDNYKDNWIYGKAWYDKNK